jgi:hypothetical protein
MTTSIILVPDALKTNANSLAVELGIDPDNRGTMVAPSVPVDGPDDATPTYWGCSGSLGPFETAVEEDGPSFPGALWVRVQNGRAVASWDGKHIGERCNYDIFLGWNELKRPKRTLL